MSKALIIVNADVNDTGKIIAASPATEKMITALKKAIVTSYFEPIKLEIIATAALWSNSVKIHSEDKSTIYCPLTIQLPDSVKFPAKNVFLACKDLNSRRRWVEQYLGYKTVVGDYGLGHLWLPIVLTTKGPLYGEVIGEGAIPNSYEQPIDFADEQRQSLYHLAYNLLQSISAIPSVYLLQFGLKGKEIVFDRLWPFPAAPALASLQVQEPDLFTCHWHCLTEKPIKDLTIMAKLHW